MEPRITIIIPDPSLEQGSIEDPKFIDVLPPTTNGLEIIILKYIAINMIKFKKVFRYILDVKNMAKHEGLELLEKQEINTGCYIYTFINSKKWNYSNFKIVFNWFFP